ncbi:hypothetical protein [Choristoneura rosaceana nucleopolyhedrovirus]|uniref:Uncharacterized protein n=1 Tax=Choristoneura rosaceana nucleopolyhedrovirus TaxID=58094 RepID=S5MRF5_9ABAC|nr:hypothetical protein [Choristoneura rosaceana nucleopolyhedrovirus]AGR57184.1 hypothetical protein [Choristoneura rosaceana nucleopolyhedrovirus]
MVGVRDNVFFVFLRQPQTEPDKACAGHSKLLSFNATLHNNIYNNNKMNRSTMKNAAAMTADYEREQLRRDLNSLRRSVHELCTRSTTGFDCNRILDGVDKAPAVIVKTAAAGQHSSLICDKV